MAGNGGGGSRLEAKRNLHTPGTNFNPRPPLLWTCKLSIVMFWITLCIILISSIVQQTTLCISELHSYLSNITSEFHGDNHMTFLLFPCHHSNYATYMRLSELPDCQLIVLGSRSGHIPPPLILLTIF